jgi:hypothetical protein
VAPETVLISPRIDRGDDRADCPWGLFVSALVAAGYQLYAVNPMSTSRYRDRHSTSGAKSDAGDAEVLADMVRTDRRLMAAATDEVEALKVGPGAPVHDVVQGPPGQHVALDAARVLPRRSGCF